MKHPAWLMKARLVVLALVGAALLLGYLIKHVRL